MNKRSISYPPAGLVSMHIFVNNIAMYDIPIETRFRQLREFVEDFPDVKMFDYYTDYNDQQHFLLCINLRAQKNFTRR